jgi:excisionase family DNA binding protein
MSNPGEQTNKPSALLPQCFTVAELAGRLSVSRRTVERALWSGELEHYRLGARIIIAEPAAFSWLNARRIGRTPGLRVA